LFTHLYISTPGHDDEVDDSGNIELTELNGKPVHTTIGRTALEAWSRALIKLGLVDEVIVELSMEAVKKSRDEALGKGKTHKGDDDGNLDGDSVQGDDDNSEELDADAEPYSDLEKSLRKRIAALKEEYSEARTAEKAAAEALADARMLLLSPFVCNPFAESEGSASHQASWMASAIRKEKSKMGSTGNKRKIVTASDLLERNDTFLIGDVEALVEGLPGSEHCTEYVFLKKRGTKEVNKAVVQEQQQKQQKLKEKEEIKHKLEQVKQKQIEEREKARIMKLAEEAKARNSLLQEKELKRKIREDERDARKRQRLEEEEEKKKQRADERLARLTLQVDDRLYKEADFQREKVVVILAKNLSREMARRRRAAELVAGQVVVETKPKRTRILDLPALPPLGKQYDEDILRIWDFLTTFSKYFVDRKFLEKHPSLDSLQSALDALRGKNTTEFSKNEAVSFVTRLAVAMCKPLTGGLTRMLFASLIALNPTLQKEFNAAFFNEATAAKTKEEGGETAFSTNVLLPVNEMTWTEIARIAFLSDALGELGYSRQETAHFIRGYRSVGHPNSKEAKRLRKVEDFPIALLRQSFAERLVQDNGVYARNKTSLNVPSFPERDMFDWVFYIHNLKSLKETESAKIRMNLEKCCQLFEQRRKVDESVAQYAPDLEQCVRCVESGEASAGASAKRARNLALDLLDKVTGEVFSRDRIGHIMHGFVLPGRSLSRSLEPTTKFDMLRPRMGELEKLVLTKSTMKELARSREKYMSDAMVLKEEMKRQELKEAGEDDDDDDDDDDDEEEDAINGRKSSSSKVQEAEPVETTDASAETKDVDVTNELTPVTNDHSEVDLITQNTETSPIKIGKETEHDDFCGDIPSAPDLIRRCLAVLRTLTQAGPAEAFLFPVDPQTNPGYYDMLIRPMCLREVGLKLQAAAKRWTKLQGSDALEFEEATVADFARNVRLIGRNCIAYTNAGPMVVCAGAEMLRIFERLLLDWVLAPEDELPKLSMLDDDLCVDPHPSDIDSTVLLCDGCEGNFNISRLDPPMKDIPKGDWYCPRCLKGRWWGDLDPRIGKIFTFDREGSIIQGTVTKCFFAHPEGQGQSLLYEVKSVDGKVNTLPLDQVDEALASSGQQVPRIRCLDAVAESIGYGSGVDHGYRADLVPVLVNPNVADGAAQVSLSSSVFRDSISASTSLVNIDPEEMTASEWLRLLTLLLMKCSSRRTKKLKNWPERSNQHPRFPTSLTLYLDCRSTIMFGCSLRDYTTSITSIILILQLGTLKVAADTRTAKMQSGQATQLATRLRKRK
jgi:Bromodomain